MNRPRLWAIALLAALVLPMDGATAQGVERVRPSLLRQVMPEADRFDPADGDPPVKRAYRGEELIGYVFLTSDLPPEEYGYSGPIRAVVGMTPEGNLTGVRVTDYHETYMRTKGDFLRTPGFQEQYAGKYIGDRFRVYDDIDGIARVSISIRALSRGVRDTARRVAAAYRRAVDAPIAAVANVMSLPWFEMRRVGVAARMEVSREGEDEVGISVLHLSSEEFARYLVGSLYGYIVSAVERRGGADQLILYVVDGSGSRLAVQQGWSIVQNGDTTAIPSDDVVMLGSPWEGLLSGETSMVGVLILDRADVSVAEPLTFVYDRGPETGTFAVDYTSQAALAARAEAVASALAAEVATGADDLGADNGGSDNGSADNGGADDAAAEPVSSTVMATVPVANAAEPLAAAADEAEASQLDLLDFTLVQEESALERLMAGTSWPRVAWTLLVLVLAALAFFTKIVALRWASLAATFVVLGFVDGGFLSVSHITSVIWVGPSAILNDLPLLLMVVFTLVTVVFWGRVFCGFLCPFGALQDFIDRVVPARFKLEPPAGVHRAGLKVKYAILAIVLLPALAGSEASIYQYFEPFGTVFFLSPSAVLWTIAGAILVASVVVPRFYCRYACPLGASLAIASLVSLKRIRRVEQCDYCKVCQQKCPTGAITGPEIDFKECVRCNVCEVELIEQAGVCRHDMETIRPRLVQLKARSAVGLSDMLTGRAR